MNGPAEPGRFLRMSNPKQNFDAVAKGLLSTLYRVARRFTPNPTEAEDLVSQTLLSAARGWASFDGQHPKAWMLKVMKYEHLHNLRRSASRPQTVGTDSMNESEGEYDVWREVDIRLVRDRILEELDQVPEDFRVAVGLCDIEQMSYADAARALEVPIGTLRSRLHRGRHVLRHRLAHLMEQGTK